MKICHIKFVAYTHVHLADKTCHILLVCCNRLKTGLYYKGVLHGYILSFEGFVRNV
jgi:hypothetical protein